MDGEDRGDKSKIYECEGGSQEGGTLTTHHSLLDGETINMDGGKEWDVTHLYLEKWKILRK
jgi:hypothetical protein